MAVFVQYQNLYDNHIDWYDFLYVYIWDRVAYFL